MTTPNLYDLSGPSTHVLYWPSGRGGPVSTTGPKPDEPVLEYLSGSMDAVAYGALLTVSSSKAGDLVTAQLGKPSLPGAVRSFTVFIPGAILQGQQATPIKTIGVLALHRAVADVGPGQAYSYTEVDLTGTAAHVIRPLVKPRAAKKAASKATKRAKR